MAKMKLKVGKAGHINPSTGTVGFVPRIITSGRADYEDIVEAACSNTTLHKAEAKVAFELCMETVVEMLRQGYIVDLGPVGRLYPSCSGKWVERAEEMKLEGGADHQLPTDKGYGCGCEGSAAAVGKGGGNGRAVGSYGREAAKCLPQRDSRANLCPCSTFVHGFVNGSK